MRIWSCSSTRKKKPECKIEIFFTSGNQKKTTVLMSMVIVITVNPFSKQWDVTTTSVLVKACRFLTDQDIDCGNKKKEMDDLRREHKKEKGYKVEGMWECE